MFQCVPKFLLLFPLLFGHAISLKTFYFDDLCRTVTFLDDDKTIRLGSTIKDFNSSAILIANNFGFYSSGQSCTVNVVPPPGYGVVASVRRIDLRPNCVDTLTITDSDKVKEVFCGRRSYSNEERSVSSSGQLTVIFKTGDFFSGSTLSHDGFQLTVTTFKNDNCSPSYEFECQNNHCIAKELTCDGHNHCGDGSDQRRCGLVYVRVNIGVILGCIFAAIAFIAGVVYCCKKHKNRTITTFTARNPLAQQQVHPPPEQSVYPPPEQPVYPAYGTPYPPQTGYVAQTYQPWPNAAYPPPPPYQQPMTAPPYPP